MGNGDDDDDVDPFADDDDLDDDDDDLGHGADAGGQGRGSWWRNVVGRGGSEEDGGPDSEDDEEFGDFAMAESDAAAADQGGDGSKDKGVFRPLAVNPAKEAARSLSGLWPFSTTKKETAKDSEDEVVVSPVDGEDESGIEQVKEAATRASLDDEDEVVVGHEGR